MKCTQPRGSRNAQYSPDPLFYGPAHLLQAPGAAQGLCFCPLAAWDMAFSVLRIPDLCFCTLAAWDIAFSVLRIPDLCFCLWSCRGISCLHLKVLGGHRWPLWEVTAMVARSGAGRRGGISGRAGWAWAYILTPLHV